MLKKFLFFIVMFIIIFSLNISYATDVVMNLNDANSNSIQEIDNTTYLSTPNEENIENHDNLINGEDIATTTTTDYDEGAELSVSNIINIILISIGIVLILLGIAIVLKLK